MRRGRLPNTVAELMHHFPEGIPVEFREQIEERSKYNFLFCYDKELRQLAGCTGCGQKVVIPKAQLKKYKHKAMATCPGCGRRVEVRHTWRGIKSIHQEVLSYHFAKSEIMDGAFTCMAVYTSYQYHSGEPWLDRPLQEIDGLYVFIPGEGAKYAAAKYKYYFWHAENPFWAVPRYYRYSYDNDLTVRQSVSPRHKIYHKLYDSDLQVDTLDMTPDEVEQVVGDTAIGYAWGAYRYLAEQIKSPGKYIKLLEYMCKYPKAMEQLGKVGFDNAIYDALLRDKGIGTVFNMRGATLDKMTKGRLTKKEKQYLQLGRQDKGYGLPISIEKLRLWQKARQYPGGRYITMDTIEDNFNCYINGDNLKVLEYVRYDKLQKYLKDQHEKHPGRYQDIGLYSDYINNCVQLGADMKSKSTLWPKDLVHEHNQQRIEVDTKKQAAKDAIYQKRKPELMKKYSYGAGEYAVIVPDKITDLVREGVEMHNCVATYIDRVAENRTVVVFIRRRAALGESFGTMEISRSGYIVQARGKYNRDLPEDAMAFVKQFEKEVLEKARKIA